MRTPRVRRRVASYQQAIDWIAYNDDTEWLKDADEDLIPSVTASLVADLFGRDTEQVAKDLRRILDPRPRRKPS